MELTQCEHTIVNDTAVDCQLLNCVSISKFGMYILTGIDHHDSKCVKLSRLFHIPFAGNCILGKEIANKAGSKPTNV